MRDFVRMSSSVFLTCGLLAVGGCKGGTPEVDEDNEDPRVSSAEKADAAVRSAGGPAGAAGADAPGDANRTGGSAGPHLTDGSVGGAAGSGGSAGSGGAGGAKGGAGGSVTADAGAVVAPLDCGGALFCENFDNYPTVTTIADKQRFGPWHAALRKGATMDLDGIHKVSGSKALHVHIDNAVNAGGRLLVDGNRPIFAGKPTHLYGRMMMYIDPNGSSVHWTFFGASGPAEPSSPVAGRYASYIMSSLPRQGINTYSFVYGLSAPEGYHDCSSQSTTAMPSAWACVSFEMDSVTRKLRMYKDGAVNPVLSVDEHGKGCVPPTMRTSPWYGPVVNQLFVGAWSFHAMKAPLDVWIDDVVVDTKPVPCTAP